MRFKTRGVLPGFGLSLGYTVFYVCLLVLLPLSAMIIKSSSLGPAEFWAKAEVENRANRLAPNLTAQEATEGLRQLARKKRPEKTPDQAA